MKEIYGNAWKIFKDFDALCITTNGAVKKNGACVMGRGIAYQAKKSLPGIDLELGNLIKENGNIVQCIRWNKDMTKVIIAYPTKHHWQQQSDIDLIVKSAHQLEALYWAMPKNSRILLPRPGCSNGRLLWSEVKPKIAPILNDNIYIVTYSE